MKKFSYKNAMPYEYDINHRGAHYKIGEAFKNTGEFLESCAKFHRGLDYMINPNTSYDNGSDIESLNASVKSSGASLASIYGNTYEDIARTYFENVHSTLWIYMMMIDDEIIEYHMNKNEFKMFLNEFHEMARESGSHLIKVRLKKTSNKMIKWLDEKIEA